MADKKDFNQSQGHDRVYVGYYDKAAGYRGSILTIRNRSDLTGENTLE